MSEYKFNANDSFELAVLMGGERAEYIIRNNRALNIYGAKKLLESAREEHLKLTAQVEELKAALAHSTSVMCSLRKCYEEDDGLFRDTSKSISKNNELLTSIGEDDA